MTAVLPDLNSDRLKRRRIMTHEEFQQENTVRGEKRKRLEEIYEQQRADLETNIIANVNELLHQLKRRKKLVGKRPHSDTCCSSGNTSGSACSSSSNDYTAASSANECNTSSSNNVSEKTTDGKKYDEETVKAMMAVALETQKEKMFESFIEEHLEYIAQQKQFHDSLQPHEQDLSYIS